MADPSLFRLRVVFAKSGRLCQLSHLEIARTLERIVRRAQLPYAITQGFSPHMKISFGSALPVGVGGTREFFDLFLTSYVNADVALKQLQQASPADLMPEQCFYVAASAPAASVAFPVSTFEALLSGPAGDVQLPETVAVVRKKKERVLQVAEYLAGPVERAGNALRFSLEAKPTGSLRPDALMREALHGRSDVVLVSLTRVQQADGDGKPVVS